MTQEVVIRAGELGTAFAKRYPGLVKVVRQPAGLDFYKIDWDQRQPGIARIENVQYSIAIRNVLGISTTQDLGQFKDEGLFDFTIYAGITEPDRIAHDEARVKTYAILRDILNAGWTQVIERSEPRLGGKARQDYMFATSNVNGLDATYMPTLGDWMRIESRTPWMFYANGLYLDVMFTRERTLTDVQTSGSYLLTFHLQTEKEYFRGFAGPDDRLRWKEVVPAELSKAAASRAHRESELRARGVAIDEAYRDPPVAPMR